MHARDLERIAGAMYRAKANFHPQSVAAAAQWKECVRQLADEFFPDSHAGFVIDRNNFMIDCGWEGAK